MQSLILWLSSLDGGSFRNKVSSGPSPATSVPPIFKFQHRLIRHQQETQHEQMPSHVTKTPPSSHCDVRSGAGLCFGLQSLSTATTIETYSSKTFPFKLLPIAILTPNSAAAFAADFESFPLPSRSACIEFEFYIANDKWLVRLLQNTSVSCVFMYRSCDPCLVYNIPGYICLEAHFSCVSHMVESNKCLNH
eukprot:c19250_g1_i5 orf=574-1149(-)